jgi:TPR repeat protein
MSDLENLPKLPRKLGPITLTRKNILKICTGSAIVICGAFGVNSYFSYQHQVFLENYSNAIASIQNKDTSNYDSAFKILKEVDENGTATATDYYYLGYALQYGYGTNKDYDHAFKYYSKSARDGDPRAYYQMATLYQAGQGVNKDQKKAISYYKKSYDLGYSPAVIKIFNMLESNSKLLASTDPKLLYKIYEAIADNRIKDIKNDDKNKYLLSAAAEGYEPALIKQAQNFTNEDDNYRALMLWQTLLYSSNPATAKKAKIEIAKLNKLLDKERAAEKIEEEKIQVEEIHKEKAKIIRQVERQKEIEHKIEKGLSVPKREILNLDGLIYINLFNSDKQSLQNFYKNITGIKIDNKFLNNSDNTYANFVSYFLKISKLKENRSSLFMGDISTNKFEGLAYYYFNENDIFTKNLLNAAFKNKPKNSSLLPKLIESEVLQELDKKKNNPVVKSKKDEEIKKSNKIELTHEEQMQRLQVFAQKGDYKKLYKLEQIAQSEDPYAMYFAGEYYYNEGDYKKALKLFKESANANYGPANYRLASLYYNEEKNGVPFDKKTAIKYYERAAKLGVRNAKHILMLLD